MGKAAVTVCGGERKGQAIVGPSVGGADGQGKQWKPLMLSMLTPSPTPALPGSNLHPVLPI
jgi:hypothetical protein